MLVLGAQLGFLYGTACTYWFPAVAPNPTSLAIVGMAAFFTAVVRAPITGIVLVTEMTSSFTMLLPMLSACFAAYGCSHSDTECTYLRVIAPASHFEITACVPSPRCFCHRLGNERRCALQEGGVSHCT
jgi:H+/Cl- antiporter ClcA